jgi:hypothetical protein
MLLAEAARLLVRDRDHLCPPGPHVMLVAQVRHDFLMRHFLPAGSVKVLEPARPVLARFRFDSFVTHSGFDFSCCHSWFESLKKSAERTEA